MTTRDDLAQVIHDETCIAGAKCGIERGEGWYGVHMQIPDPYRTADAILSRYRLIPLGDERANRIIDAALLAIADRAPLYSGPAPTNTNPFDAPAYDKWQPSADQWDADAAEANPLLNQVADGGQG